MKLRLFTRKPASQVQPGDVIETPRAMTVEEVVNSIDGIKLVGRRSSGSRRVSVAVTRDSIVELPVESNDTAYAIFAAAFTAMTKQSEEDEIPESSPDHIEWMSTPGDDLLTFKWQGEWIRIGTVTEPEPGSEPESELEPEASSNGAGEPADAPKPRRRRSTATEPATD